MYSVLVADDNSNIQKMVTLLLKEHGIEVVAVGNGEAAVRKLAEFRPHLILADVFMPVRNGYEVCEFVKKSRDLSTIPVILLVGAFDPLDEEEARRVGADGVLKKPFVPPDPLVTLVKSTLENLPQPAAAPAPANRVPVPSAEPEPPSPPETELHAEEPPVEEFGVSPPRLDIRSEETPIAFHSLLDTGAEPEESALPAAATSEESSDLPKEGPAGASDDDTAGWGFAELGHQEGPPSPQALADITPSENLSSPPSTTQPPVSETAEASPIRAPHVGESANTTEEPLAAPSWPAWEKEWPPSPLAGAPQSEEEQSFANPETPEILESVEPEAAPLPGAIEMPSAPAMRNLPEAPLAEPALEPSGAEMESLIEPAEESQQETVHPVSSFPPPQRPDPVLVESIVEQLVERLRPQIEQATRDALRPVAEQILQQGLGSSRSRDEVPAGRGRVRD